MTFAGGTAIGAVDRRQVAACSAVLIGRNIDPRGAAGDVPRMWINPWSLMPISDTYSLAITTADDNGKITAHGGQLSLSTNCSGCPGSGLSR